MGKKWAMGACPACYSITVRCGSCSCYNNNAWGSRFQATKQKETEQYWVIFESLKRPAECIPDSAPTVPHSCCSACYSLVVFFTLTDRASTIPSNIRGCQSGTWSQRGTKVNGSHHGNNPLLRPTGIQIATKSYATLQAMAPTNNKTVHKTSFTPYREQPRSTRIVVSYPQPAFSATDRTNTFQPVLINNSKFLKATHRTKIRKIEIPRSIHGGGGLELVKPAREPASSRPKPCA